MASLGRSFFGRFFGRTIGEGAAFAMGTATAPALRPLLQDLSNLTWEQHPTRPPDVYQLATGVSQGQVPEPAARAWAKQLGYGDDQFTALIDIANVGPGVSAAFELWRRDVITEAGFRRAVKRLGLEQEWIDDLVKVKLALLDEAQLANAIHRGLIDDQGLLLGHKPGAGKVPAYPVFPINALTEAMGQGIDRDRLGVLVGLTGLPMGPHEAAQATFRGVIDKEDYFRAIAEGNTRNEWADAIFEQSRNIPSPTNYVEGRLRGWLHTDAEMYAGAARQGMTQEDTHLLFLIHGRPATWHQVWIGLQRGGTYDGPTNEIDPAFLASLRQSDLRPEWYNLLWHSRYNYPTAFVLRSLTQGGDITQAEAEQILKFQGWEPTLAHKVSLKWAGTTGAVADPHVAKAENQVWTTLHKTYVLGDTDEGQARNVMGDLGIPGPAQGQIVALWNAERTLRRKELTDAALRKAVKGQQLTRQEALDELVARGYTTEDANIFLDQSPKPA